ncbi:flagellar biosynthesis protein FlhF [Novosphingobium marinum]|uniref:DUF2062 domain-containing protein n=1 Tax=Novosphingobium marinum TaxID=1514948 RepID=A0A7Z0BWW7_9SPHN|nr:DUF2062 domain-containing protein [Novosphingobium marinum]NYH96830.1 hypothetical protein [Novosphingobium marinum]GGC39910.1 flagellar biosynthesis protein FlhF [Novosphingobium marinum]
MGARRRMQRWAERRMPNREEMARNKYLAPIAHRFLSPELWRFTRRSVPRGVALGIFSGFIIPLGQIFLAAFLALPARANVPVAVLVTFITNPFTLPFWLVVANRVGRSFLRIDRGVSAEIGKQVSSGQWESFSWFFQTAGVTAVGFVIMAIVGSAIGYLIASFAWRGWVGRKWSRQQARRVNRTDA